MDLKLCRFAVILQLEREKNHLVFIYEILNFQIFKFEQNLF
jgi:hypothetical protein